MAKLKPKGRYIVGAYATSPNLFSWDEKTELNYFNRLKEALGDTLLGEIIMLFELQDEKPYRGSIVDEIFTEASI